ncbi:MAG: SDR family NAD(P)-dependent oxidoreductase, partial [Candidatus Thermoplasmatota archaeon]|nr:SDR family NAD(P)-dependent oxidoreductase [Candidatus Thermoplasmatota archaeon]
MKGAVLVTGGGRRIGRSISLSLASSGFHVVIQTRSVDDGINLVADEIRSLGSTCTIVEGNLESSDSPSKLLSDSIESLPHDTILVGLVNCASMFHWDAP